MIELGDVKKAIAESEFRISDSTEYVTECQSEATGELIYLANKAGLGYIRLIVHPDCDMSAFGGIAGVTIPSTDVYYNMDLRLFPKDNNAECHYGMRMHVESIQALRSLLRYLSEQHCQD
jgi:hypothetical protein